MIGVRGLGYTLPDRRTILAGIDFDLEPGRFLAVLGENGAGKTTLLDLLMGFRRRTAGTITVLGRDPETDPWESRARIAYLSEKHDVPGDWEAGDYLDFHRRFYARFDADEQRTLVEALGVRRDARAGTLSAGEARRVQIVGALAARPELLIADEITALLDILGRRRFLRLLKERQARHGLTVVLATNVPEGLEAFADTVLVLSRGRQLAFGPIAEILEGGDDLAEAVARRLEAE